MIYLDNSATTAPAPEVIEDLKIFMNSCFGNPSSLHEAGRSAMHDMNKARSIAAGFLGVESGEVYFTSGGTESDNIAVLGAANMKRGGRIVTTAIEHPAVLRAMDALEERGFEVVRVMPEEDGRVDAGKVIENVNDKTCLVSVMHVNNETGAVMDIKSIAEGAKERSPRVLVHTDAVQSFGHIETKPYELGVDLMSVSGHKIHSIKGSGLLFVKKGVNTLRSPVYGGGQEKGIRSGTENIYAIHALGKAIELIDLSDGKRIGMLREKLKEAFLSMDGVFYNGGDDFSPYILNMSFKGVRSEVMLNALDAKGIMVSSASACAKGKGRSHVLAAMGAKYADNAIRFSLSRYTLQEDIDTVTEAVKETLRLFRR